MEQIKILVYILGGKFIVINLILLILIFFIISSVPQKRIFRLPISIFSSLIITLQLTSLYFTKSFVGYDVYIHLNTRDIISMAGLFTVQIFLFSVFFIFTAILFYFSRQIIAWISSLLKRTGLNFKPNWIRFTIFSLSIIGIMAEDRVFERSYELFSIISIKEEPEFQEALNNAGLKNYVLPSDIEGTSGKNIVIISLESYEKAYFHEKFSHLTPNFQKLKNNWNYYEMNQNPGSEWTSGSLYTTLTGFPAFFGRHGNSIFQTSYYSSITSLGNVFKNTGYSSIFYIDDAEFSGTKEMLYSLQIETIYDKKNFGTIPKDWDLFNQAKKDIRLKSSLNQPFVIFISTMSTHHPDGIYDERMESYVLRTTDSTLEFMVSAVDFMVDDFLKFLENEDLLKNTVVYIFPDHLKMGNTQALEGTGSRGLYLLTNASKEDLDVEKDVPIDQIDLPKLILKGAGIKHNAKFLTDYITGSKGMYLEKNINKINAVNTSGLLRLSSSDFKNDPYRFIAHAGGKIDGFTYTNSLEALNYNYLKGFKLFELDFIKTSDSIYVAAHDWEHWAKIVNYEGVLPVTHEEFLQYKIYGKYTPLDIKKVNEWFSKHDDAILVTDKVNQPKEFSNLFVNKNRLMMELFTLEAVKEGLEIGIRSSMPSQNIIDHMEGDKVKQLITMGVQDIAVSQRYISSNRNFLKRLKEKGIRTFVYHVNFDQGKDETYFVENEKNFIFGLYADKWNFENKN